MSGLKPPRRSATGAQDGLRRSAPKRRSAAHQRVWNEAERASAVALLARNGGNVKRTAREWKGPDGARVPESTLRLWRDNPPPPAMVEAAALAYEQLPEIVKGWVMKLAVGLGRDETIARLLAKPSQAVMAMAIAIDKVQLLTGGATERIEATDYGRLLLAIRELRERGDSLPVVDVPAIPATAQSGEGAT